MVDVMIEIVRIHMLVLRLNPAGMQMLQHMQTGNINSSVSLLVAEKVQVEIVSSIWHVDLDRLAVVVVQGRAQEDPRVKIADPQVVDGMHLLQHLQDRSPHVRVRDQASSIRLGLDQYPREIVHRETG